MARRRGQKGWEGKVSRVRLMYKGGDQEPW